MLCFALVTSGVLRCPLLNSGDSDEENRWDRPVLLSDARECLNVREEGCKDLPVLCLPGQCFCLSYRNGHSLYFQALVRLGYKFLLRTVLDALLLTIAAVKRK